MPNSTPLLRSLAFFGMHLDLHPGKADTELGADADPNNINEFLDRIGPDYVQYDCKGHPGYTGYPTEVGWASPGIVKDALMLWRRATKERDIRLAVHYSGVLDGVAVEKHPEWASVDCEGATSPKATSTFGPYVDQLLIPQLIEIHRKYAIDAVWADGECWGVELDWSNGAMEAWRRRTGLQEAPKTKDDLHWEEWKDFHRDQFERYLSHWVDAVHKACPGMELCSNWAYSSMMPKRVGAGVDFLSGDFSATQSVDTARLEARYLSAAGMPWDLMAWGFSWSADGKIPRNHKPAIHLMQEAASVLMLGGGFQIYYTPTRRGFLTPDQIDTAAEVAQFCRQRQAISHKSQTVPQVAVLLSEASFRVRSQRCWSSWSGEYAQIHGVLRALLESHYSVDVMAEWQLDGQLQRWPVVVLPEVIALEPALQTALETYVRQGGNLVLMGASSIALLAELSGVAVGPVNESESAFLPDGREITRVTGQWASMSPGDGRVILERFPTADTRVGGAPAAVCRRVGQGAIVSVAGPLAGAFAATHHPTLRRIIASLIHEVFPEPMVSTDAPPCVDLSIRTAANGSLTIHLANFANLPRGNEAPIIDHVPPVGPITLRVACPPPQKVILHPQNAPLEWIEKAGRVEITLPRLDIHAVIEIV